MDRRERLVELIELAGLTRKEVADEAGVTPACVSFQVSGDRGVSDVVLEAAERLAIERLGGLIVKVGMRLPESATAAGHYDTCQQGGRSP